MIDGHCHLDKNIGNCDKALHYLHSEAVAVGVKNIILLNLPELAFEDNLVIEKAKDYNKFFKVFPSVNPTNSSTFDEIERLKCLGASGLKLHPRFHGYRIDSNECINLLSYACELGMPVMIDSFPDGKNLYLGNTPEAFARSAERFPDLRIAIGHAGGHRILDALMVAKYYKNIYLDISYSLLYYRNSRVIKDIAYTIESIRAERIFWGSDYPDRPYGETVSLSLQEFGKMNLSDRVQEALFVDNVKLFLGKDN